MVLTGGAKCGAMWCKVSMKRTDLVPFDLAPKLSSKREGIIKGFIMNALRVTLHHIAPSIAPEELMIISYHLSYVRGSGVK